MGYAHFFAHNFAPFCFGNKPLFSDFGCAFALACPNLLIAGVFYYLFKVEIHIYSLAGITVSFGIIIDNSIVMVSHLQRQKGLRVFISLLAATLTTLGALSVVFFLKDNQKVLLIDFTYVMLINLTVSLLVALFLVSALMENIYHKKAKPAPVKLRKRVVKTTRFYARFIDFEKRFKSAFPYLLKSKIESKAISLGGMDWGIYGVGKGFSNALNMDYKNSHILLTGYNYDQLYGYAEQLEKRLLENGGGRVEKTEITSSNNWRSNSRYE